MESNKLKLVIEIWLLNLKIKRQGFQNYSGKVTILPLLPPLPPIPLLLPILPPLIFTSFEVLSPLVLLVKRFDPFLSLSLLNCRCFHLRQRSMRSASKGINMKFIFNMVGMM